MELFVPGEVWTVNKERTLHYHKRAALVEPMRRMAWVAGLNWLRDGNVPFANPVTVAFYPVQGIRGSIADTANHLGPCKAVLDGIVDAGILPDDTPEWVLSQTFYPPTKSRTHTGITITIQGEHP